MSTPETIRGRPEFPSLCRRPAKSAMFGATHQGLAGTQPQHRAAPDPRRGPTVKRHLDTCSASSCEAWDSTLARSTEAAAAEKRARRPPENRSSSLTSTAIMCSSLGTSPGRSSSSASTNPVSGSLNSSTTTRTRRVARPPPRLAQLTTGQGTQNLELLRGQVDVGQLHDGRRAWLRRQPSGLACTSSRRLW